MKAIRPLVLDLASTTGWAFGEVGSDAPPLSGSFRLKGPLGQKAAGLDANLRALVQEHGPTEMTYESPLPRGREDQSPAGVRTGHGFAMIAEMVAYDFGLPIYEEVVATTRLQVMGRGTFPAGEVKEAVMEWCRQQGFQPNDDNEGDALVLFRRVVQLRIGRAPGFAPGPSWVIPARWAKPPRKAQRRAKARD